MRHVDLPPEQEYLPVFEPPSRIITDVVNRNIVHETGLHHGHVNVWIPGIKDGTVYKQIKAKSHGKADATIGGHIDCTREIFSEVIGRDLSELAPKNAAKEGREETGIIFSEQEIIPLGETSEIWGAPHPESKRWNNGVVFAYVLNRRVALGDILGNSEREEGLDFEEVHIETLLGLTQKDRNQYLGKLLIDSYKEIFLKLRDTMRHI